MIVLRRKRCIYDSTIWCVWRVEIFCVINGHKLYPIITTISSIIRQLPSVGTFSSFLFVIFLIKCLMLFVVSVSELLFRRTFISILYQKGRNSDNNKIAYPASILFYYIYHSYHYRKRFSQRVNFYILVVWLTPQSTISFN